MIENSKICDKRIFKIGVFFLKWREELSREILGDEIREYEDEIDLVDLLKILVKNKGMILLTTIIITMISIGGALYLRSNKIDKFQQNFRLRNYADAYYSGKAKLIIKSFDIEEMLLEDETVNKFYANDDFNGYFLENTKAKILLPMTEESF